MEEVISFLSNFAFIPKEMLLVVVAIPVSAAVGFALGLLYERWYHFSAVQRMGKRFEKLFDCVTQSLEKAEQACQIFNQHPESQKLNSSQREAIESLTSKLSGQLNRISQSCANQTLQEKMDRTQQSPKPKKRKLKPFKLPNWELAPADQRTGFPDATAYQANLQQLLVAMQQTDSICAVLFVKLDHYTRHAQQFGATTADAFVKKTGSIVLRKFTQNDLVTQVTEDLLIVIVPDTHPETIQELSNIARKAIRSHRYINPETEQEVFVTASFSYTVFDEALAKDKKPDQELWDRCQNALSVSQKNGRCQLHEMTSSGLSRLVAG